MSGKIFIGSAWPYTNGSLHLGHLAGLSPADLLARYFRLAGYEVLWVSGSDCHGTPITLRAEAEGVTPQEICDRYHQEFVDTFNDYGFTYDLYWMTADPAHHRRVQESFTLLAKAGVIVPQQFRRAYCPDCKGHLADRELRGECPICGEKGVRGDQCDQCTTPLGVDELINPTCEKHGIAIDLQDSTELAFDLPKLAEQLEQWIGTRGHWRTNALQGARGLLESGLKSRSVSREMDWGISVPLDSWEGHCIYVWLEAVHGYMTASMEWAEQQGDPELWKRFWIGEEPDLRHYLVIGKDNIPFHTLWWPGVLMARDKGFALPWHVVSSEYLQFGDKKASKSKGNVVWAPDFAKMYPTDTLRYFLFAQGPETRDTNFTWELFIKSVNGELVNNFSNLVHRVLTFVAKRYDGQVPPAGEYNHKDHKLAIDRVQATFGMVGTHIEDTEFKQAIQQVMRLVKWANQYMNEQAPWAEIKEDPARAATTINVLLQVIAALSVLIEPFIPFAAEQLQRDLLQIDHSEWSTPDLPDGHQLGTPVPLFTRLRAPEED